MLRRSSWILLAPTASEAHFGSSYAGASSDYDCAQGYSNWRNGWAVGKKNWCCQNRGLGCPDVSYPSTYPGSFPQAYRDVHTDHARVQLDDHYDCVAGYGNWKVGWSADKKDYCCIHQGLACPQVNYPQTYPGQFPSAYQEVYPDEYQNHVQYGGFGDDTHMHDDYQQNRGSYSSSSSSARLPYDCAAGYAQWQSGWSANKKEYCCQQRGLGCPGVSYPNTYPGSFPQVYQDAYPDEHRRHVDSVRRSSHYDCAVGYSNWQDGWSVEKKDQCCREQGLGCPGVDYPNTYPGRFPRVYQNAYPDEYRRHVHVHIHHHVHYTHYPPDYTAPARATYYDCDVGVRRGWSVDKKQYCCENHHIGCEDDQPQYYTPVTHVNHVTHVTHVHVYHNSNDPYDCSSDLRNWREKWPVAQKAWCCDRYQQGCTQRYTTSGHRYYSQAEDLPDTGLNENSTASDYWRRSIFIGAGCASVALVAFVVRARYVRWSLQSSQDLLIVE